MEKKVVKTDKAPAVIGPYSQATEVNGTIYISGQIPIDPSTGRLIDGGIKEQTRQVLENIGAILNAAGCSYENVVKSTCLLANMDDFKDMNEVYAQYYSQNPPARAAYGVVKLPLGSLVEIETIAVR